MIPKPVRFNINNDCDGFTLLECVLVILILGLVLSISWPAFKNTKKFHDNIITSQVISGLRFAQKAALATGCPTQVIIKQGKFELFQRENCEIGDFNKKITTARISSKNDLFSIVYTSAGQLQDNNPSQLEYQLKLPDHTIAIERKTGFVYEK